MQNFDHTRSGTVRVTEIHSVSVYSEFFSGAILTYLANFQWISETLTDPDLVINAKLKYMDLDI